MALVEERGEGQFFNSLLRGDPSASICSILPKGSISNKLIASFYCNPLRAKEIGVVYLTEIILTANIVFMVKLL